jgi:hypothetical protein
VKKIAAILTLIFLPSFVDAGTELPWETIQVDGKTLHGVANAYHLPEQPRHGQYCDHFVYADKNFTLFPSGRYLFPSGLVGYVEGPCLLHRICELTLKNGDRIETYQKYAFDDQGQPVYRFDGQRLTPLEDGEYSLKDGTLFSTENGYFTNYGFCHEGKIWYEDRD